MPTTAEPREVSPFQSFDTTGEAQGVTGNFAPKMERVEDDDEPVIEVILEEEPTENEAPAPVEVIEVVHQTPPTSVTHQQAPPSIPAPIHQTATLKATEASQTPPS